MTQVIGQVFDHGFAGSFSRQPDQIIDTRIAGATIEFGAPVKYDASGNVVPFGASDTADLLVGFAVAEVKTGVAGQNGSYATGEPVPVMKRGRLNVKVNVGTPALNGDVYIRIAANVLVPNGVVGDIEASADSTNTINPTNVKFATDADANGIAELEILYPVNA